MDSLKAKLLEKLEQSTLDLQLNADDLSSGLLIASPKERNDSESAYGASHEVS